MERRGERALTSISMAEDERILERAGLLRLGAHNDFGEMMRPDCSVPIPVNEGGTRRRRSRNSSLRGRRIRRAAATAAV